MKMCTKCDEMKELSLFKKDKRKPDGCDSPVNLTGSGLDRVDSAQGYHVGNVVPCCAICNSFKKELSVAKFKEYIDRIYNNMRNF